MLWHQNARKPNEIAVFTATRLYWQRWLCIVQAVTEPAEKIKLSSRSSGKRIVVCFRTGRLGNRVLLFAHFIAMAEEQGHQVINFAFHSYAHLFETTRRDIYCRYPATERRSWMDIIPGINPALRKTRLCLRLAYGASFLN